MTLYDVASKIHRKYYMAKWRHFAPMTPIDLMHIIEWAKKRRVFFWQELAREIGIGRAWQVLGILTAAQLLVLLRYDRRWDGDRIYYSVYVYNEAAEEFWDSHI